MDRGTGLVENTPKAFANFSPGFERSEYPGCDLLERWV